MKTLHTPGPWHIHILAPLYQQVIDWFREKHSIYIDPITFFDNTRVIVNYKVWLIKPFQNKPGYIEKIGHSETLIKAIEEALKLIP